LTKIDFFATMGSQCLIGFLTKAPRVKQRLLSYLSNCCHALGQNIFLGGKMKTVKLLLSITLISLSVVTALLLKQNAQISDLKAELSEWTAAAAPIEKGHGTPTAKRLEYFLRQLKRAKEISESTWKIRTVNNVYFSLSKVNENGAELLFPIGITKPFYKDLEENCFVGFKFVPDVIESLEPTEFLIPMQSASLRPSKTD
jgi:hypothetical protein